ncbi:unnamed protein product [Polarella glacialis]|uniref:Phosphoribosylamine--glycine ligase n=1 Tax=Polarella glacialis TaxID=89957 RepID=A0A813KMV1_POLGL|nr:unnamed protein product [Polarella glacialis]CAE8704621.1 unnamed protein product [Polarella glacialis]|eukprot:CAMPEP_0115065514 /NCGR_PEP_ID=MMETSP0227-20121206/10295_1 /TAXON_ID=89957 /ORGANISM="Polarella glacialis, Strain CCMP 1383" /LENGTH=2180 /DNA_ID=CAMNT_0002451315 /DNA_START=49 /DNA_END=6591 /DNA_ORIENTATION=+
MGDEIADDRIVNDDIGHECGFAFLRLLKPPEFYLEKYGTHFFGVNRMHLMMEKQRNRGQDGAGMANVKLDMPPGSKYIHCEKSVAADPISDLFGRIEKNACHLLSKAPKAARIPFGPEGKEQVDPRWVKDNIPFCGETYLAHVRYGTDSENGVDRCHPVTRESNWMTRNLILAGNFNITNNEDLFASLVQLGQHPRELSDTVMLLEKIGHFVDKENNDLYVKYSAAGHSPQTCFSLIGENINIARILRRASGLWDGGYCIAGLLGHGDAFVMRDPSGIRPAFYHADDEIIVVCSEAPLIQTVFGVKEELVKPLPPGHALTIKRSGAWQIEQILQPLALTQCSFERIYFSRGNDAGVYREREQLGRLLLAPLMRMLERGNLSLKQAVLTFIPNTSELAFLGLAKEAQDHLDGLKTAAFKALANRPAGGSAEDDRSLQELLSAKVRTEKVVHKDAKIRTFIQEDSSREHLTMHAYDVHYGTIRRGQDCIVALDDSIVRGNTLKNAILRTLDKLGPIKIIVVSSCPQIRYPDVYGIDMAKLGDLAAFKAAVGLLKDRGMDNVVNEVYRKCREELKVPLNSGKSVNHVKKIYELFTPEEISARIAKDVCPDDCKADVEILYQTVEDLHRALPEHSGDWYFSGDYPTPGGIRVCCRAFALWMEGSSQRCYGISSALSFLRARRPALVLGSGAREHALAWKMSFSSEVSCIFVAPGNGGIGASHGAQPQDSVPMIGVDIPITAPLFTEVINFCREHDVGLVTVGPEQMLADGIADKLRAEDILVFGPSAAAAEIEASKAFAKDFMKRHNIPTAAYANFKGPGDLEAALRYVDSAPFDVVVKASGLAAGKGVVVPESKEEAKQAIRDCLERQIFGAAGLEIVLEERMSGPECSVLALCDGHRMAVLPPAQDHKRVRDGDQGPNTGGMGAFAPTPVVKAEMLEQIKREILQPTLDGLRSEGKAFVGCLFAGLMITESGPRVIEFNCRFGDPETQCVLPLLNCDIYRVLTSCAMGELFDFETAAPTLPDTCCVSVVMASAGYPGAYEKGFPISGLDRACAVPGVTVFHAGTKPALADQSEFGLGKGGAGALQRMLHHRVMSRGRQMPTSVVTSGGRVLAVTAMAHGGIAEARERAYVAIRSIKFQGSFCRMDIGDSATAVIKRSRGASNAGAVAGEPPSGKAATYLQAGVDIEMDEAIKVSTREMMLRTRRPGYQSSGNDGRFDIGSLDYTSPSIVSSTNGVGTKLKVAIAMGRYRNIGTDLIALCANDVAARGAEPLFFTSHFSVSKLDAQQALEVNEGIADGCSEAGCAFMESKTAEMPGVYNAMGFDLVGVAVGAAEGPAVLPQRERMQQGDLLIGLMSSGLHSNGFSLLRSVVQAAGIKYQSAAPFDPTRSFGEVLLAPTRIYVKPLLALAKAGWLKAAAPITSGGLSRSIPRILPRDLQAQLKAEQWELPPMFRWIAARCQISCDELAATFNCGIGMVLVVAPEHKDDVFKLLKDIDEEAAVIGELARRDEGAPQTLIDGAESCWLMLPELGVSLPFPQVLSSLQDPHMLSRSKTLVLGGSAADSPLKALLEAAEILAFPAEVAAVLSLCEGSELTKIAKDAGIETVILKPGLVQAEDSVFAPAPRVSDGSIEQVIEKVLERVRADLLVVLDDFSLTLLSTNFRKRWAGRLIKVEASLIPCVRGLDSLTSALDAGMCVSGCTVYQQTENPDVLDIMLQETARILEADTPATLHARIVAEAESKALPEAVRQVASGKWKLRRLDGRTPTSNIVASSAPCPSSPSDGSLAGAAKRYEMRGVSADKGDVHAAIKHMDKGLFPKAFCKVVPDFISGDPTQAIVMHADGAGTKSSLAYIYWKKTGDISVWKGIAQDALIMNLDDLLCVGITSNILLSSTIGRNKNLIPGEVVAAVIGGTAQLVEELNRHGVGIALTGGETADVGDLVRTIIVDSTVVAQIPRSEVIDNGRIRAGDIIVGLSSSGRATYETCYNSGIGSNGLTAARHDTFESSLAKEFPESFDPMMPKELVYSGGVGLEDPVETDGFGIVTAGKLLLSPTRTYAPIVKAILASGLRGSINGMVHCSGGAQTKVMHFVEDVHIIKDNLLPTPPVFRLIQQNSGTPWEEMYKVFNMGHRLEFYTNQEAAAKIIEISKSFGVEAQVIGRVEPAETGQRRVTIRSEHGQFQYIA